MSSEDISGIAGDGCEILVPFSERKSIEEIEKSITKTYRKHIWAKFIKAINDYKLLAPGDKVAVAVSGGKDSLLMAKLFQLLHRYSNIKFDLEFICADPGYHENIKELLIDNCNHLQIPIKIFNSGILIIATLTKPHSQPITVNLLKKLKINMSYYNNTYKNIIR